jgi:hypothetical protein
MSTLYIRNVPTDVAERLERLAGRAGTSVSGFVLRELAELSWRADNAALLGDLPDLGVDPDGVVADVNEARDAR